MVSSFAKRFAKSSLNSLGLSLHDLRKNNDLSVFLPGHLKALLARLKINCVIDVGANIGSYGRMLRRVGYKGRIVSIEPVPEVFAQLSAAAAGDDEWMTLKMACGSREETRPINIFAKSALTSFLEPSPNLLRMELDPNPIQRTETMKIVRLDSLFDQILSGIDEPRVFLKIDCQGLDFEVLKGAGEAIATVEGLQSEVSSIPLYFGVPDYLEFLSYCRNLGFEPTGFFPVCNSPVGGHMIECDVVLIRRHWSNLENALNESSQNGSNLESS
jgi:FkbM family methyltransferase